MARLVLADAAERLFQHRDRGPLVHRVEQRRRRHLAEQKRRKKDRHRVFVHALLERVPVAGAVVIEPLGVVAGEFSERRLRLEAERPARREQLDRAPADLLVVHLIPGHREKALADRVLLMGLVGMDHRARENRRPRAVEHAQEAEPVADGIALILRERPDVQRAPRQPRRRPPRIPRLLVNLEQLRRLDPPFNRKNIHRRQRRRRLGAEQDLFGRRLLFRNKRRFFRMLREIVHIRHQSISKLRPRAAVRMATYTSPTDAFKLSRKGRADAERPLPAWPSGRVGASSRRVPPAGVFR